MLTPKREWSKQLLPAGLIFERKAASRCRAVSRLVALLVLLMPLSGGATTVNHRLREGDKLSVQTDIAKVLRQDRPQLRGIAVHGISGFMRHPYAVGGKWQLEDSLVKAIRKLNVPSSRILMHPRIQNGKEDLTQEQIVDCAADMYARLGTPLRNVVMCINNNLLRDPKRVLEIVEYGFKKGFIRWELGCRPWTVPKALFNGSAREYQRQAIEVARAIRAYSDKILIYVPSTHHIHGEWGEGTIKALAGHYDFITAHHYALSPVHQCSFEGMVLTENYMILQNILEMNEVIKRANPGRDVHQWDTQWGQHSEGYKKGGDPGKTVVDATLCIQNANIMGTMHRAMRLIHYHREFYIKGATQWEMFCRATAPGFGILSRDEPDKAFMIYWLNYHFDNYVGRDVLDISGTCPFYTATRKEHPSARKRYSGPLAPVLASYDKEKKALYYVIANGSWTRAIPCDLTAAGFTPGSVSGIIMSDDDYRRGSPLVHKESDFVKPFQARLRSRTISFTLPPHSIVMIRATR